MMPARSYKPLKHGWGFWGWPPNYSVTSQLLNSIYPVQAMYHYPRQVVEQSPAPILTENASQDRCPDECW